MGLFDSLFGSGKESTQTTTVTPQLSPEAASLLTQTLQALGIDVSESDTLEELQAKLEPIFGLAQRRGEESLQRFGRELAGGRGLNLTDTPIGGPLLMQARQLTEGIESARASTILNLQQQAMQNRLRLAGLLFPPSVGQSAVSSGSTLATPSLFQGIGQTSTALSGLSSGLSGIMGLF